MKVESKIRELTPEQKRALLKKRLEKKVEEERGLYPLSYGQLGLWVADQHMSTPGDYNIAVVKKIIGPLDLGLVRRAVAKLSVRHPILRTKYLVQGEKIFQSVCEPGDVLLEEIDAKGWTEGELKREIKADYQRPFNLERGIVFRVSVFKCQENEHVLLFSLHHIAVDGWSMILLWKEFELIYSGLFTDPAFELPALTVSYLDYVKDQLQMLSSKEGKSLQDYWKAQLDGGLQGLDIAVQRKTASGPGRGASCKLTINESLTSFLRELAQEWGVTVYAILLSVYFILLHRYTQQTDIIIGTPSSGRTNDAYRNVAGYFVNMLPIRCKFDPAASLKDFVKNTARHVLDALEHQDYPFNLMVEKIVAQQPRQRSPIFQTAFSLLKSGDQVPLGVTSPVEIRLHSEDFEMAIAENIYELRLELMEKKNFFSGYMMYDTSRYDRESVERMVTHYMALLKSIQNNPEQTVGKIPILTDSERKSFFELNASRQVEFPRINTLQQLFEQQAEANPHYTATVFHEQKLSYAALNEKASRLAGLIEAEAFFGDIVAVMFDRSPEMIVAILAVLKSGNAYLAIDPAYPDKRKEYMLENSGAGLLLTDSGLWQKKGGQALHYHEKKILFVDQLVPGNEKKVKPAVKIRSSDRAYVIYTSGSTGNPKGVVIEHFSAVNLIQAQQKEFGITSSDRIILFSSICFDASVEQIFLALSSGAALVLVDRDTLLDTRRFENYLVDQKVTHLHAVPGFLMNLELEKSNSLKRIIAGGDVCPVELARKYCRKYDFYNEYGPTETTVTALLSCIKHVENEIHRLEIGFPVYNTTCYILDEEKNLVPPGVPGEIYLGGAGVARGYLNEPGLTKSKFVVYPGIPQERLFRTGDFGIWDPVRGISFLGRKDNQVKIRGFRIELAEIEKYIMDYEKKLHGFPGGLDEIMQSVRAVPYCQKCLLPSNHAGVSLDKNGVCNICNNYENYKQHAAKYFQTPDELQQLIKAKNDGNPGEYDCLLLFSGGKDSSYVLYRLVEMGFKVLAFTFDNSFISQAAFDNIKKITKALNVTSMVCGFKDINAVFTESLNSDHTVCTGCFKALTTLSTKIAAEKRIKVVITGLSRGQILDTKLMGLLNQEIFDPAEIDSKLKQFRKLYHAANDDITNIMGIRFQDKVFDEIEFLDYFRYDDVSACELLDYLKRKNTDWSKPRDTGFCSTNCLINDAGIYMYLARKGYHNYSMPLSWDIRLGLQEKEKALQELNVQLNEEKISTILNQIGYFEKAIKDARVLAVTGNDGNKQLVAFLATDKKVKTYPLRKFLAEMLPDYMVPAYFVTMVEFPFTTTGKVDTKQMAAKATGRQLAGDSYVPPRDDAEKRLVQIWNSVLNTKRIGIYDNFFELGGDSLIATRIIWKVKEVFGTEIQASELFRAPFIAELARLIKPGTPAAPDPSGIKRIDREKYRRKSG